MAETLTTLKTRRSCRAYKPDRVEEDKLKGFPWWFHEYG